MLDKAATTALSNGPACPVNTGVSVERQSTRSVAPPQKSTTASLESCKSFGLIGDIWKAGQALPRSGRIALGLADGQPERPAVIGSGLSEGAGQERTAGTRTSMSLSVNETCNDVRIAAGASSGGYGDDPLFETCANRYQDGCHSVGVAFGSITHSCVLLKGIGKTPTCLIATFMKGVSIANAGCYHFVHGNRLKANTPHQPQGPLR
jgi:hypothetical protein